MSDRFPGEPEWTDALQAGRTEPTGWESLYGVMAHDNHGLCEKIDEQAARIAQLERREALLTELYWAILNLDAVFDGVEEEAPGGIEERKREAVLRSNRAWGAIDWLGSEEATT